MKIENCKLKIIYEKLPWHNPEQTFLTLFANNKYSFWLDNNNSNTRQQYSYMGTASKTIKYTLSNHTLSITNNINPDSIGDKTQKLHKDIFAYLKEKLINPAPFSSSYPFDFTGGYVGCLSYETDAHFLFIENFLAFDHLNKTLYLVSISKNKETALTWFSSTKKLLTNSPDKIPHIPPRKTKNISFTISKNHKQYLKDIRICKKYLAKGHAYQICLTNQVTIKTKIDWLDLYLTLRQTNPSPFNAYINFGDFALLSSSPEQFLKLDKNGMIFSKPMKGTARRGATPEEDNKLSLNLGKTPKDYAENIMIVDLVRSDLGKVCEIGSIKVENPLSVETYTTVHQLVSTIKGKLKKGLTSVDAIMAAFPGGSMTGAPKIRAMEILNELEKTPRGIYSGCFGFLSLNGAANLAMTIRTIIATKDNLSFGTGGAILADSIAHDEYHEMLLKSKAMIEAIMKTAGAKSYKIIGK